MCQYVRSCICQACLYIQTCSLYNISPYIMIPRSPLNRYIFFVAGDCRDCAMPATRTESLWGSQRLKPPTGLDAWPMDVCRGLQSASSCMGSALDPGGTCQVECRQPYYKGAEPKGYWTSTCLKTCLGIHGKSICVLGDGSAILQHVGSLVLQHVGSS